MRNLFKKTPVLKTVGIVWVIFATLYVLYGEYNRLEVFVAKQAYQKGITDSVIQLMQEATKCQPIPVTAGDAQIDLIALDCLTVGDEEASE